MRITSKGTVTIPDDIRREAGMLPGADVDFVLKNGEVILKLRPPSGKSRRERDLQAHLERFRGSAARGWTTEKIMKLTRGDD